MNKLCLYLAFCLHLVAAEHNALCAQSTQDIPLPGIVVRQNSRKADGTVDRISGVDLRARKAIPTQSDAHGNFTLIFSDVPPGNTVRIQADRIGMEVVNQTELENAAVLGRTAPLKVVMCPKGELYENQVRYYAIAESEILKRYEKRRKILETKSKAQEALVEQLRTELATEINSREEALELLAQQKEAALAKANELSNQFARVNLDDASELYRKAFEFFQAGEIDQALGYLRQANLPALVEQILEEERRLALLKDQVVQRDSLKELRKKEAKEGIQLQLDLYESLSQIDSVLVCYELLVRVDPEDGDNLMAFGEFLTDQRLDENAANILIQATKLLTDTIDLINTWNSIGHALGNFDYQRAIEAFLIAEELILQYEINVEELSELGLNHSNIETVLNFNQTDFRYKVNNIEDKAYQLLPFLMALYSSIGYIYKRMGNVAKAEEYCLKSLNVNDSDIAKKYTLAIDSFQLKTFLLAISELNLAQVYTANMEYEKAEAYLLDILSKNHSTNDTTFNNQIVALMGNMFLAEIYTNVNQPEKAEKAALKMLQIAESANIESDSLNIYQSKGLVLMFLADFYQKQRRYSEAEKAYDLLIETYSKVTNNKSNEINLAEAYYSFGEFYFNIGKFSECIDFYKKSGEIYLNHFETNPNLFGPKAAIIAKKVGDLLGFAGGLFEQADSFLIIAEHIYNRLNLIDSVWRGSLADVYSIKGKNMALQANPNAERVLNEATDLILETFKSDSAKLSVSLANIEINRGIFFANLKEYKSALDAYKNALYFMLKVKIDADKSFGYIPHAAKFSA